MAGKSETKHILLDMAGPDATQKFSKKLPADVVLLDGLIFLYKKGNDLCNLRIAKQMPSASGSIFDDDDALHPGNESHRLHRKETGTWGDLGRAFERMLVDAFATKRVMRVVLGFDKREYISPAKDLVQRKRRKQYAADRERQIAKDLARGVAPTQGIPFTLEELTPESPLPYPWSVVAADKSLLTIVIQYIVAHHVIKHYDRLCRQGQELIIDGHGLGTVPPETFRSRFVPCMLSLIGNVSNDVPLRITFPLESTLIEVESALGFRNTIGECDHMLFHYIHLFFEMSVGIIDCFRILTTDTDLLLLAVCMVERRHPKNLVPTIQMQVPTKIKERSTFQIIHVNRLVDAVAQKHSIFPRPVQNIAFAMYLKSHDYDAAEDYEKLFFNRIGHAKIVDAYLKYAAHIGPIVQWTDADGLQVRGDAIKKVVHLAYFHHYDQMRGKQTRIYPAGTSVCDIDMDDLRRRVADKNAGKKENMQMHVPNDNDIIRKALRMQFLATLCDDAVHGRASADTRSISDARLEEFGYSG